MPTSPQPECNVTFSGSGYSDPTISETPLSCILETSITGSDSLSSGSVLDCDSNNICIWSGIKQEFYNSTALNQAYLLNAVDDGYLATIVNNS